MASANNRSVQLRSTRKLNRLLRVCVAASVVSFSWGASARADGTCSTRAPQNACGPCRLETDCGGSRSTSYCQRDRPRSCGPVGSPTSSTPGGATADSIVVTQTATSDASVHIGALAVDCGWVDSDSGPGVQCTLRGAAPGNTTVAAWMQDEVVCDRGNPQFNTVLHGGSWSEGTQMMAIQAPGFRVLLGPGVEVWVANDFSAVEVATARERVRLEFQSTNGSVAVSRPSQADSRVATAPWMADLTVPRSAVRRGGRSTYPCVPPSSPPGSATVPPAPVERVPVVADLVRAAGLSVRDDGMVATDCEELVRPTFQAVVWGGSVGTVYYLGIPGGDQNCWGSGGIQSRLLVATNDGYRVVLWHDGPICRLPRESGQVADVLLGGPGMDESPRMRWNGQDFVSAGAVRENAVPTNLECFG